MNARDVGFGAVALAGGFVFGATVRTALPESGTISKPFVRDSGTTSLAITEGGVPYGGDRVEPVDFSFPPATWAPYSPSLIQFGSVPSVLGVLEGGANLRQFKSLLEIDDRKVASLDAALQELAKAWAEAAARHLRKEESSWHIRMPVGELRGQEQRFINLAKGALGPEKSYIFLTLLQADLRLLTGRTGCSLELSGKDITFHAENQVRGLYLDAIPGDSPLGRLIRKLPTR